MSFANGVVLGATTPRIFTPPLRELTPETSFGFEVIDYARDTAKHPLDPWQEEAVIRGGELLPDGRPRFRIVLVIVSRQEGKTELATVLSSWWLTVDLPGHPSSSPLKPPTVLGTSSKLDYARESWQACCNLVYSVPELQAEFGPRRTAIRNANGEQCLTSVHGTRYKIAAANADAGRSLTVHRLIMDELRQHTDYLAWDAAEPTTSSVPDAQIWCLSNAGTNLSVVLNTMQDQARQAIEDGTTADAEVCLLEWSAPEDSDPEDMYALAMAKPNLGRRGRSVQSWLKQAREAKLAGGEKLAGFNTEHRCVRASGSNPAISAVSWAALRRDAVDLAPLRSRVALAFDISADFCHVTAVAAAQRDDGVVLVDPVASWHGPTATRGFKAEFPSLVRRVRPARVVWMPQGPTAAVVAELAEKRGWPPPGVATRAITSEGAQLCMGLAEMIRSGQLRHPGSPLLDLQIESAQKKVRGSVWHFERPETGSIDAVWATAAAVHEARTMPLNPGKPRLVVAPE